MKKCPDCGYESQRKSYKNCPKCGTPLVDDSELEFDGCMAIGCLVAVVLVVLIGLSSYWEIQSCRDTKALRGKTAHVLVNKANVRSKSSDEGEVLFQLNKNDQVVIEEKGWSWFKVNYEGRTGWIHERLIKVDGEGDNSQTEGIVIVDTANVRKEPNGGAELAFQLKRNDSVLITDRDGSWIRIDYNGQEGWIYGDLVEAESRPSEK